MSPEREALNPRCLQEIMKVVKCLPGRRRENLLVTDGMTGNWGGTRGKEATGCQNRKDRFQLTDVRRGRKEREEEDQDDGNRADCIGGLT